MSPFRTSSLPLLCALSLGLTVHPSSAQAHDSDWVIGEVRMVVPELPEVGQTFEVPVRAETGGAVLAALTLRVSWNPAAATLVEIRGGLSTGARRPFVVNDRLPGKANISDINAPRASGKGGASYNNAKRGRIELYKVVLRRTTPTPLGLTAELAAFHDPGEGAARKPTAIGGGAFPRAVKITGDGAGPVGGLQRPIGDTWMTPGAGVRTDGTIFVVIRTQLGGSKPARFSLSLRFDPATHELTGVAPGLGGGKVSKDASVPGALWISGGEDAVGQPDARSQAVLCVVELKPKAAESKGSPLAGKVVSFHRTPGEQGEGRTLGPLPLPRKIGSIWPSAR